jgi:hypothetical protein
MRKAVLLRVWLKKDNDAIGLATREEHDSKEGTVPVEAGILIAIILMVWTHIQMYKHGKRIAFSLIERHTQNGFPVEKALQYERDVMEGKVPRG